MPVVISPDSELGKELAKWEQTVTKYVPDGEAPGRPYQYRPYPRMLYRAVKKSNGKVVCVDNPLAYDTEREQLEAERVSKQCQRIVQSDVEERNAMNEGWRESPTEALSAHEQHEQNIGQAAAELEFSAQRMSAKARAEIKAAHADTSDHVVDVKPKRKYNRKTKGVVPVTGAGEVTE